MCVCLCGRRAARWKFNLECHSFEGGPAACQRRHDNLHRPQLPHGGRSIKQALLIFYKGVNKVRGIFRRVQDFFLCLDVSVTPVCVCLVRYLENSSPPPLPSPTHTQTPPPPTPVRGGGATRQSARLRHSAGVNQRCNISSVSRYFFRHHVYLVQGAQTSGHSCSHTHLPFFFPVITLGDPPTFHPLTLSV